jgi:4-amino-4-deoxy-L-arabinose transferase-like glycosyltransferase
MRIANSRVATSLLVLIVALVVRFAYLAFVEDSRILFAIYDEAALNLLEGNGLVVSLMGDSEQIVPFVWYPPGYPIFLAVLHSIFGPSLYPIIIAHVLLGAFGPVFLARATAIAVEDERVGIMAGLAMALTPTVALHDVYLSSANGIPNLLLCVSLYSWFSLKDRAPIWCGIVVATACTLAMMFRSEFGLLVPVFLISCLFSKSRHHIRTLFVIVFVSLVLVLPASIRNYRLAGQLRSTPPGVGLMLVQSIGKYAPDEKGFGFHEKEVLEAEGGQYVDIYWPDPYDRDGARVRRALDFAVRNPVRFLGILAKNTPVALLGHRLFISGDQFSYQKQLARGGGVFSLLRAGSLKSLSDRAIGLLVSVVILISAASGLFMRRTRYRHLTPFWLTSLLFFAAFIPLGALGRYTIPAYIAMIPLAAILWTRAWQAFCGTKRSKVSNTDNHGT